MNTLKLIPLVILMGCFSESNIYVNDAPTEMKSEPEYRQPLSDLLLRAPSVYAQNLMTVSYNRGYKTGKLEHGRSELHGNEYDLQLHLVRVDGADAKDLRILPLMIESLNSGYDNGYNHK